MSTLTTKQLRALGLTAKQLRALQATADPDAIVGIMFWADARASWQGPRRTLGSLYARGLVTYSHEDGWKITDAGRELVEGAKTHGT